MNVGEITAGELRERITLSARSVGANATWGTQDAETYTDYDTVWARVQQTTSSEKSRNTGLQTETTHQIKIRYLDGVKSTDRVTWAGRVLHVLAVHGNERRTAMILEVKHYEEAA